MIAENNQTSKLVLFTVKQITTKKHVLRKERNISLVRFLVNLTDKIYYKLAGKIVLI